MKKLLLACAVLGLVSAALPAALAQDKQPAMQMSSVAQTPEWQMLKSLAGNWQGAMDEAGKKTPTVLEIRMTGDSSAMMHIMGKDSPQEMVTMFHPDGDRLLATHYCAAHNQPRMALVKGKTPNQVTFEFIDGTNIKPGDLHIKRVVLTVVDADHHNETWTAEAGGKEMPPAVFAYTRKK